MIEIPPEITEYNEEGFFILNEGSLGTGQGSVSFYHREYAIAANNIFKEANGGAVAGSGIHSMNIINGKAYFVAKNSNTIIIVNPLDMTGLGEITGFELPKNIIQVDPDRAYVSQWGQDGTYGSIKIVDLNSNTIVDSIPTRRGPEEMIKIGNNVFVANTGGIFIDSVLTKISVLSDEILKTIDVGLVPTYLEVDKDLNIWTLTRGLINDPGDPTVNIKGRLTKIENDEVVLSLPIKPASNSLTINNTRNKLYFVQNGWVYEHLITSTAISLVPYIEKSFYGLEIDPKTGNLIGMDAGNLEESGELYIYDSERTPLDTVEVGVAPVGAFFQ